MKNMLCGLSLMVSSSLITFNTFAQKKTIAQKPVIDTSAIGNWPTLGGAQISNDGKYVAYTINNQPVGSHTLVVQASEGKWKREFVGANGASFTEDSKKAVFLKQGDSLAIVTLGTDADEHITHVKSFKLSGNGNGEWLAYQQKGATNELVLVNLVNGKEQRFDNVNDYLFSPKGNVCVVNQKVADSGNTNTLLWVDLVNGESKTIWEGEKPGNYVFDEKEQQLAFMAEDNGKVHQGNSIWCYEKGMDSANC